LGELNKGLTRKPEKLLHRADLFGGLVSQRRIFDGKLQCSFFQFAIKVFSDAFEKTTAPQIGPELFPIITNGHKSFNMYRVQKRQKG